MATEHFTFTSIDIVLDGDLTEKGEQFDTMMTIISDCGGAYEGLCLICSIVMYFWYSYKHSRIVANAFLYERFDQAKVPNGSSLTTNRKISQQSSRTDRDKAATRHRGKCSHA